MHEPYPIRQRPRFQRMAVLAVLFGLFGHASADVTISFTRVVDTDDSIPGTNKAFFTLAAPALDGREVAFYGSASLGDPTGIYLASNSAISTIVDTDTQIPGAPSGVDFVGFSHPSLSDGQVAFTGATAISGYTFEGVVLHDGSSLSVIAKNGTPVPDMTGEYFIYFFTCSLQGDDIGFHSGTTAGWGVFSTDGGLHTVADESTLIPGTNMPFDWFYPNPTFSHGSVAFSGANSSVEGVYSEALGLHTVADTSTSIPGGTGTFTSFADSPVIRNDHVVFFAQGGSGQFGLYLGNGTLSLIADDSTAIPDGSGTFTGFGSVYEPASLNECGSVAFRATGDSGQIGIYTTIGGQLIKLVDIGDTLDGDSITNLEIAREAVDGNRIAFVATFSGGQAIYIATVSLREDLDHDGDVDDDDLAILEAAMGPCRSNRCPEDLDGDGDVDCDDADILIAAMTDCY